MNLAKGWPDRDGRRRRWTLWVLLGLVGLLIVAPSCLGINTQPGVAFVGADSRAEAAIHEVHPQATPWFQPLWAPSREVESLLFALQAALGAGAIGYFLGLKRGEKRARRDGY